jgi:Beta-galactosidase trimerisation domain
MVWAHKLLLYLFLIAFSTCVEAQEGHLYIRFNLKSPKKTDYYLRLSGNIHEAPWYIAPWDLPQNAATDKNQRFKTGIFTDWFDLLTKNKGSIHGKMARSGGVSEYPNLNIEILGIPAEQKKKITIELSDDPNFKKIIKKINEEFVGESTSILISPDLKKDFKELESANEMTLRRLSWAKKVSKGKVYSPKKLIIQTSFYNPQRESLNIQEAEVLRLLGFNTIGNQSTLVKNSFDFARPSASHDVVLDLHFTDEKVKKVVKEQVVGTNIAYSEDKTTKTRKYGPMNFADEVVCLPAIPLNDSLISSNFRKWLKENSLLSDLPMGEFKRITPISTPKELDEKSKEITPLLANKLFYYTARFRQLRSVELLTLYNKYFKEATDNKIQTSTLVADHPYFAGTGLGMGIVPNSAWGGHPLALDWFEIGRKKSVDLIGIEDWLGLQYMYGPSYTWEGFQLIGFQASMFRSASDGNLPIVSWITPSDETNIRLKSSSALCQGAKNFYFWTYGPTNTSTENYWSDIRSAYDGIYSTTKNLTRSESIIGPGKTRKTKVAILYSISSDLWQPYGYIHMLERRGIYLSLIHDQFLVDFISEEDVENGKLQQYDVLYTTDPCIKTNALNKIKNWVKTGGNLVGTALSGTRNEFNEPVSGLNEVFGIKSRTEPSLQNAEYHIRGALNNVDFLGNISTKTDKIGAIAVVDHFEAENKQEVVSTFSDGKAAIVTHAYGKGNTTYIGTCIGISYIKDARFVPLELAEKWQTKQRLIINAAAHLKSKPLIKCSEPVVEAGIFDAPSGTALILANFNYSKLSNVAIEISLKKPLKRIESMEGSKIKNLVSTFDPKNEEYPYTIRFNLNLNLNDIILLKYE